MYIYFISPVKQNQQDVCVCVCVCISGISQVAQVVKNSSASAGDVGFDPWVGKIPWRRK